MVYSDGHLYRSGLPEDLEGVPDMTCSRAFGESDRGPKVRPGLSELVVEVVAESNRLTWLAQELHGRNLNCILPDDAAVEGHWGSELHEAG